MQNITEEELTCRFCGAKFDLGYHYTCHACGATYCYIHMSKHMRAHRQSGSEGRRSVPADPGEPLVMTL